MLISTFKHTFLIRGISRFASIDLLMLLHESYLR